MRNVQLELWSKEDLSVLWTPYLTCHNCLIQINVDCLSYISYKLKFNNDSWLVLKQYLLMWFNTDNFFSSSKFLILLVFLSAFSSLPSFPSCPSVLVQAILINLIKLLLRQGLKDYKQILLVHMWQVVWVMRNKETIKRGYLIVTQFLKN